MKTQKCCTSCGLPIPDGQGKSCSMCYGDINYGRDGYYRTWAEQQENKDNQDCLDHGYQDWVNEQIEKNHQNAEQ